MAVKGWLKSASTYAASRYGGDDTATEARFDGISPAISRRQSGHGIAARTTSPYDAQASNCADDTTHQADSNSSHSSEVETRLKEHVVSTRLPINADGLGLENDTVRVPVQAESDYPAESNIRRNETTLDVFNIRPSAASVTRNLTGRAATGRKRLAIRGARAPQQGVKRVCASTEQPGAV